MPTKTTYRSQAVGEPVILHIYDMSPYNKWFICCGVGIFHSGIEVYGAEYAYGGHPYNATGVFATKPKQLASQGQDLVLRTSVVLGYTNLSPLEVSQAIVSMGRKYRGLAYHLLQQNCNSFTDDLTYKLLGRRIPPWVNRLANVAILLHCLLPPALVPPLVESSPATEDPNSPKSPTTSVDRFGEVDSLLTPPTTQHVNDPFQDEEEFDRMMQQRLVLANSALVQQVRHMTGSQQTAAPRVNSPEALRLVRMVTMSAQQQPQQPQLAAGQGVPSVRTGVGQRTMTQV